ncbi:hypothetical protein GJ744_000814 [Endocarpon pusillum]|uniref:Uncharacterized protein n=1 Tax=Endocarpon pusillum TaxID=364733 RepID=A0A8H7ANX8_9EURO|nr:hypothetical protein GJ744_000814 [Endocarpon pusillum]
MGPVSKVKSLAAKVEKNTDSQEARDITPPPTYRLEDASAQQLTTSLRELDLSPENTSTTTIEPSNDECIAHLKFLTALAILREDVSESAELFGIRDAQAEIFRTEKEKAMSKIREKRWAVYVARAVDRFESWFNLLPTSAVGSGQGGSLRMKDIVNGKQFEALVDAGHEKLVWKADLMPPLDVLMVLHSFMLNPRDFLEDCIRQKKMMLWHAGFPWNEVNACIDAETFLYTPKAESIATFEASTSRAWDNLHDPPAKQILCPSCGSTLNCVWTDNWTGNYMASPIERAFELGRGLADKCFHVDCRPCNLTITHETLRLLKLRRDIESLQKLDLPLPGTILSVKGTLKAATSVAPKKDDVLFPNRLILAGLGKELDSITYPPALTSQKVTAVRTAIEKALKSRHLVSEAKNSGFASRKLEFDQKVSIRRMMSRYWENSSPFALDLVGAVLRQGVFIDKMKSIDWIHSPALESTMTRLLKKYAVFFQIMAENPGKVAVPTLDIDLAWHTHQLNPPAYYAYSLNVMGDDFIDHDDKIDENKLSDAFEWTSKRYQKITGGQIYSECTCWYCEAVRETHNNRSIFSSAETSTAKSRALQLHDRDDVSGDPRGSPHISAHNAVREQSLAGARIAAKQQMKLDAAYKRAVEKARGAGKKPPTKHDYAMTYVWGYPMYVPTSAPYTADPCITGTMYSSNPSCMNTSVGASGNCVAGACGGSISFGGCGSTSACGGGTSAGGCGGSSGGGGGGCGGGGGGC